MLYDPKWEVELKPDMYSLASLITWLETQRPDETYCYLDHGQCLLGQYFKAQGFTDVSIYSNGKWKHGDMADEYVRYPDIFNSIALHEPRTFGAALDRARAWGVSVGDRE